MGGKHGTRMLEQLRRARPFGARVIGNEMAKLITQQWLETEFEGGRHQRRVNQLMAIQNGVAIEDQVDPGPC